MPIDNSDTPRQRSSISPWHTFREGLAAPWAGFHYMSDHPKLWRYGIWPIVVNLLTSGLLFLLLVVAGGYFFTTIHPKFGEGWLWLLAEVFVGLVFMVIVVAMTVAAWLALQSVLCAWFYDRLARRVELQLGVEPDQLQDVPVLYQATDAVRNVAVLLTINLGCLAIQFIPGLGTVLGLCGSYYFTSYTLGLEYFDYPLALRGLRRPEKLAFGRRHRLHVLGLGTAVAILALVPIVNAVLLTTAVTGAVLLHRQIAAIS
jgi:CysZ protein